MADVSYKQEYIWAFNSFSSACASAQHNFKSVQLSDFDYIMKDTQSKPLEKIWHQQEIETARAGVRVARGRPCNYLFWPLHLSPTFQEDFCTIGHCL